MTEPPRDLPPELRGDTSPANRRDGQLAAEIGKAVQSILARGLSDPRIRGLITVTGVDILDQRRRARVKVTVLPQEHEALTMHGLRAATGHIRKEAMARVRSRMFPQLEIVVDEQLKNQNEVLALIAKANESTTAPIDPANDEGSAEGRPDAEGLDRGDKTDETPDSGAAW